MLKIRPEQMAYHDAVSASDFIARARGYLRSQRPEVSDWTDQDLEQLVLAAMQKARTFRVASERNVVRLAILILICGSEFPYGNRFAWARSILKDTRFPAGTRLVRIQRLLAQHGSDRER